MIITLFYALLNGLGTGLIARKRLVKQMLTISLANIFLFGM
jgi:hypothetical protein